MNRVSRIVLSLGDHERAVRILTRLPDRILLVLLSIFVATYSMAAFGIYRPYTVLPLIAVLILVAWRFVPTDTEPSAAHAWGSIIAVVLGLIWIVVQFPFETEFLVASRDPGIYTNLGAALATTGHSAMDVSAAVRDAAGIPHTSAAFGSFVYEPDQNVRLQGGNAVPSMIALGYWVAGINGLTVVNSIIGGVTLIGLYSLGRRLLGPLWGLLPPVVLGLSMPMVYFSRAPYTEVLSAAIFIGALIWVWSAFSTGKRSEFVVAGAFAGATAMTRIDATLGLAVLIAAFALVLLGVARPKAGFPLVRSFAAYIVPAGLFTLLGIFDLTHNFNRYVHDLGSQTTSLWELLIGVVLLSFAVIGIRWMIAGRRRSDPLGRPLGDRGAKNIGGTIGVLVPVVFVYWALRPLFIHFQFGNSPSFATFIESLQRNAGLPLNGQQTYDEYSLDWFAWYFGIPFVIAASIGLGIIVYRAFTRRRPGLLIFWMLTMGVAMLYLNKISIAPDQMWAFRRVLPIVAPGFIIGASWAVRWLGTRTSRYAVAGAGIVGTLIVVGTTGAWTPHLFISTEYSNQANEIRAICADLGNARKVVLVDRGPNAYSMTLHNFCNVEVVSVYTNTTASGATIDDGTPAHKQDLRNLTQSTLHRLDARMGAGTPVVTFDDQLLNWQGTAPPPLQTTVIDTWSRTLLSQPKTIDISSRTTWVGTLTSSGLVKGD